MRRRMYSLVERCLSSSEPVLLVGETGTGKTTVCQLLALMRSQHLHILNCNQHTETADFLGGFRPTRNREAAVASLMAAATTLMQSGLLRALGGEEALGALPAVEDVGPQEASQISAALSRAVALVVKKVQADPWGACAAAAAVAAGGEGGVVVGDAEVERVQGEVVELQRLAGLLLEGTAAVRAPFCWCDGPLVTAMRRGDLILVDEVNLAEDAVLERLNRYEEGEGGGQMRHLRQHVWQIRREECGVACNDGVFLITMSANWHT